MSEWQETTLQDVVSVLGDGLHGTPIYDDNGEYYFVNGNNLSNGKILLKESTRRASEEEYLKYKKPLNDRTILLSINGTLGNVALYNNEKCFLGKSACYFNVKKEVDKQYIRYVVTNKSFQTYITEFAHGTTIQNLSLKTLREFPFELPPLEEQKAIASVLSSLDDKIDLLHRQNTTLERMAEALFRQWFVEEAQSFATGKIGALIEATFGGDWGKEAPEGDFTNAVNCIRGTDIADLQTGLAKKIPLRFVSTKKLQSIEPKNGDIIFEISGGTEIQSTGRATYINDDVRSLFAHPLVFSNFCRLLRPLNLTYSYFIYLYLSYLYEQDEFFGLENGSSGIKNLNYKALFFELNYPMPSLDRVQEFNDVVTPSFSKINQNKKQMQTLEKLRDNLLPKLMSGEVRVNLESEDQAA